MNFIKEIFEGKSSDDMHSQFQKFSRGEFRDRALVRVKKQGNNKFSINTGHEFANGLVKIVAEKLGNEKTNVTGAIISTLDLKEHISFKNIKQFQGVKRYLIDQEMSGTEIVKLVNDFNKAFFALSFKSEKDEILLKIKPKAPKSGKPSSKNDEGPKIDFCSLKTKDKKIVESFVFEKTDFEEATINHVFLIKEIVVPKELKNEKDFAKIREMAKRKGTILRTAIIDGKEIKTEKDFEA